MPFDGSTYDPTQDRARLTGQLLGVYQCLRNGSWYTLRNLSLSTGGSEASVSARLRDLRKDKFGGWLIDRRRVDGGLYEYRLRAPDPSGQTELFG